MNSIARYTYPRVVWRNGKKLLWNPIHRKPLKNRPEERVRLKTIEYLLASGWPRTRISTEETVGTFGDSDLRTDIICYDRQFQRKLLIECKAGQIPITAQTAQQAARYNQMVKAPYLMLTNGRIDYWYTIEGGQVDELPGPPKFITPITGTPNYEYLEWQQYGFAGEKASDKLQKWLEPLLPKIWGGHSKEHIHFLNFNPSPTEFPVSNYYHVRDLPGDRSLALTTINTPGGGTRLIAVISESQENQAVLEVNLDHLFDDRAKNTTLHSAAGTDKFDLTDRFQIKETDHVDLLYKQLAGVFNNSSLL